MEYTGNYRGLLYSGLFLSAISMVLGMAPYICIWLVIRDLVSAAPNWTQATEIAQYGWMAFAFAVGGILIYLSIKKTIRYPLFIQFVLNFVCNIRLAKLLHCVSNKNLINEMSRMNKT